MSVVYSCVVDGDARFQRQACTWAQTLITHAGRHPDEIVVHAVEGAQGEGFDWLRALGIRIEPVPRFDARHAHSNKLRQLDSPALCGADRVVLCDCDTAFAGDLEALIEGAGVRAKRVDTAQPPLRLWEVLFEAAGFDRVPAPALATQTGELTYRNNCNGGLYVLDQRVLEPLRELWPRWATWTLDHADLLGELVFFSDQISFGLALEELGLQVDPLPLEANFPTHIPCPPGALAREPLMLHYHGRVDADGLLLPTGVPEADRAIARVNGGLRRRRGVPAAPPSTAPARDRQSFDLSLVVALDCSPEKAWRCCESIAALDDALAYEVVMVADMSGAHDALLTALGGDVTIRTVPALTREEIVGVGVGAATGRRIAVLTGAPAVSAALVGTLLTAEGADVVSFRTADDGEIALLPGAPIALAV
jgi:hypothetical protein